MSEHQGGCLCGAIRYSVSAPPLRVTTCHCRFCQRATGGPYMVEPIFAMHDFQLLKGEPQVFSVTSEGSGKRVDVHFCQTCGSHIRLGLERFPNVVGVYAGTFDDPNWFEIGPDNSKHIFLDVARHDSIVPAGIPTYPGHAIERDGTPKLATTYDHHHKIG